MPEFNWQRQWKEKLRTADRAMSLIRRGDRIFIGSGAAVPQTLVRELVKPHSNMDDHPIIHILTLGTAPYAHPDLRERFRHNALFIGSNVRDAVADGRADYTPIFLSEIPQMMRLGRIPIDVSLIQVSPPDSHGFCSLGVSVDVVLGAVEACHTLIAEVNPRMPRTLGDCIIHVDRFDALVPVDYPLPELPPPRDYPEAQEIAKHVANLIEDGATLQIGIGSIPATILQHLEGKKDLGVHTEMLSDGLVALAEKGVITGRRKKMHPGKIVAAFAMGTKRVYDFVNNNPMCEFHPADYTNNPVLIGQHEKLIAINTCLEVDLTGQVCSDSIGSMFYSGIGGQVDFIRGAARSPKGKPIIALCSTARNGTVSRIVPRLSSGSGVVTTRGDVHYVATEYGVAMLHGKSIRERTLSLIQIAHPKFRSWLLAEAKQRNYVYQDQLEVPVSTPLYPRELERHIRMKNGQEALLRPILPADETMMREMFYRMSDESVRQRFFSLLRTMPRQQLQQFCNVDYKSQMTLVVEIRQNGTPRIVAFCGYTVDPATSYADVHFETEDAYQGLGLGSMMMEALAKLVRERGLSGMRGEVLASNSRMLHLFHKIGFPIESALEDGVYSLRIPLDMSPEAARKAKRAMSEKKNAEDATADEEAAARDTATGPNSTPD